MSAKKFDIIAIGDSTLDVFLEIDEATVLCDIHKENCRLCFNYADKIPVKRVTQIPGVGNAANNAYGSARLGLRAAIYTVLGSDDTGREIRAHFRQSNIALDYVQMDKKRGSNFSTVLNFQGERTILVYHEKHHYSLPRFASTRWVYYTSLAAGHDKLHSQLPRFIKKSGAQLAFNPGTFQLKEGVKKLRPILQTTELLIVNREEGERLVGKNPDIKQLMRTLHGTGPKMIVVTDGQNGAYLFAEDIFYYLPIFDSPVVERTGCGDAFSTGFIAGLIRGNTPAQALRWASFASVGVLQEIGAQKGFPSESKMRLMLRQHPDYQAKKI